MGLCDRPAASFHSRLGGPPICLKHDNHEDKNMFPYWIDFSVTTWIELTSAAVTLCVWLMALLGCGRSSM